MIAIKEMEMPSCCVTYTSENDNYTGCPFYKICEQRETIKTNYKPNDCPLLEIVTCKDCTNYVKGALDEEICLRGHELIHENFYCADAERRE